MTTSHMYLVITTAVWMNKTSNRPQQQSIKGSQNVPFGVFGIMLPYKTVRSTHFSNLCVSDRRGSFAKVYDERISGKNGYGHLLYH